jgi:hypothetical protein
MPERLDRLGLTDERIIDDCLRPGLYATETKFFAHEGHVISRRVVEDHASRHKFLTTYLTLRGHLDRGARKEVAGMGEDAASRINLSLIDPATARALLPTAEVDRGPDDANDEDQDSTGPQVEPEPEMR